MKIYVGSGIFPGTVGLHIQARPPAALAEMGSVPVLKPSGGVADAMRRMALDRRDGKPVDVLLLQTCRVAYQQHLREALARGDLAPGRMVDADGVVVEGVTLVCTCSPDEARAGRCHRAWIVEWLDRAGWDEIHCDWLGSSNG